MDGVNLMSEPYKKVLKTYTSKAENFRECPRCLLTSDIVYVPENRQCEYCDIHDKLEKSSNPTDFKRQIEAIRSIQGQYNCLIGISGGLDSSVLLYAAVRHWGLRPLVIHFDNHFNTPEADHNIDQLIKKLNVNFIRYYVDKNEYDTLNDAFLAAGVPDADIPNDIAMTKLMYDTASKYGIKWILNGHDFREEGSTPAKWTYMDARYIQDVYFQHTGLRLENYPLFTFLDQIKAGLKGIRQLRPFHYNLSRKELENEMIEDIGWKSYGAKHGENIYTEFVGAHLLPVKFNIDKRIVYLSAQVRSGIMDKSEAKLIMKIKPSFSFNKFGSEKMKAHIAAMMSCRIQDRANFKRYDFRKYKLIIWILKVMKVVPETFYIKYAK